eukprot:jgi/Botrbrau1/12581/Bobra.0169s0111.3
MMQMQGGSMCTLGLPLTVKSRSFTCPVRIAHGLSTANPSRWRGHIILLSEMIPTPNAAVRLINRLKLLIDDTPTLSNAKKALWGWAAGEYDETQTRKKVEKLISQNKVMDEPGVALCLCSTYYPLRLGYSCNHCELVPQPFF